jgi:hypothetical protein
MARLAEARRHIWRTLGSALLLAIACSASRANAAPNDRSIMEQCIAYQAQRFGLDPTLMRAIATVESNFNPRAVSPAGAVGLMQINRTWLPTLAKFGIVERDLYDPCTSAEVGAWILSQLFLDRGASWVAVGAYNAACTVLKGDDCTKARASYAWKVFRAQAPAAPSAAGRLALPPPSRGSTVVALSSIAPLTVPAATQLLPAQAARFTRDVSSPSTPASPPADAEDDDQ